MNSVLLFIFFTCFICTLCDTDFKVVTDKYIRTTRGDIPAGFGDFNADKLVDIFVIRSIANGRQELDVLLADQDKPYRRHTLLNSTDIEDSDVITGLILADFDNDVQLDILLITSKLDNSKDESHSRQLNVYWGNTHNISLDDEPYQFKEDFIDDPMLFSSYASALPKLMTRTKDGRNILYAATPNRTFLSETNFLNLNPKDPQSTGFIDLNSDFNPDLLVTTETGYSMYSEGKFDKSSMDYTYPPLSTHVFQSAFGDFNQDGVIEHVVPYCTNTDCSANSSQIAVYSNSMWINVWTSAESSWIFEPSSFELGNHTFYNTLRVGDYDFDAYPDILVVLKPTDGSKHPHALLLHNKKCQRKECEKFGREFEIVDALPKMSSTFLAAFYDINDDGTLDVLMTGYVNESTVPYTVFVANTLARDACFLKVTVVSGKCFENCPSDRNPYSVNVPGPTVRYQLTTTEGKPQSTAAGQVSQTGNFALQLPYVMFGLGETPNFIDQIITSIPHDKSINRTKIWQQQIIPNSQLIVIPHPINQLSSWKMQLFVTPSRQIYLTGICLLATCGLLAIIVAILQWREMREDAKEKKQESQKFHFDAM